MYVGSHKSILLPVYIICEQVGCCVEIILYTVSLLWFCIFGILQINLFVYLQYLILAKIAYCIDA